VGSDSDTYTCGASYSAVEATHPLGTETGEDDGYHFFLNVNCNSAEVISCGEDANGICAGDRTLSAKYNTRTDAYTILDAAALNSTFSSNHAICGTP
jgi:hypothetical protein